MRISEKLTVATILVIVALVGVSMWKSTASDEGAAQEEVSARWLALSRTQRARIDTVTRVKDSLALVADRAGARYQQAKAQLRSHFAIDSAIPRVALTVGADTTQLYDLVRLTDTTHFVVPLEFIDNVRKELAAADSAYRAEHLTRVYQDSFVIPYKDTLIKQLAELSDSRGKETEFWKKKANPRCGTKCKLAGGALLGEGLRRLVSEWIRGHG